MTNELKLIKARLERANSSNYDKNGQLMPVAINWDEFERDQRCLIKALECAVENYDYAAWLLKSYSSQGDQLENLDEQLSRILRGEV